jgi:hypothetical protein
MASNTYGIAEGIFLFSLATALYGDATVQVPQPKPAAANIKNRPMILIPYFSAITASATIRSGRSVWS